ncbi:MAG: membrane dipeptidase [Gemmatimonas sp. SM23_52]|nr:MAG: membrane dipeptidase [Gemmatimonas sp. SM23_52]
MTEQAKRAAAIHRRALVVDGHNDLPWKLRTAFASDFERFDLAARHDEGHTDIPRLREGGVDALFFAAYVPSEYEGRGAARLALEQIDLVKGMVDRYPELELARSAADVERIARSGKIAALVGVEGGHTIEGSLAVLRSYFELGARYLTLTHNDATEWADAATDEPRHGGLSGFGEEVIREMNRLGMLVDISHVSFETMAAVLRVSEAPVIASHSGARAVNDHPRNVPDEILERLPANGGVVMVNFFSGFVVPAAADVAREMLAFYRELRARYGDDDAAAEDAWQAWWSEQSIPRGTVSDLVDHIDHIVQVAGIDHVGLGSDFDGCSAVPEGLEDVSKFPAITEELVDRGYAEQDIIKILGQNALRALAEAEVVARRLAPATPRSSQISGGSRPAAL